MSRLSIEIPDSLHQQLKANASLEGMSLRDFVLQRLGVSAHAVHESGVPVYHVPAADKPADAEAPAAGSMRELLENRPWKGTMTRAEIDARIAEERASWHDDR